MARRPDVKESLMKATTELIRNGNGDITEITTRDIARKAGVGIGLVNYHFQSKDRLITLCVQRMIGQVVMGFDTETGTYANDRERLADWASRVFEFLFENPSLSRISILSDLAGDEAESNTVNSQRGLAFAVPDAVPADQRPMFAFMLTSAMQIAFLLKRSMGPMLGVDLEQPQQRHAMVGRWVDALLAGLTMPKTM